MVKIEAHSISPGDVITTPGHVQERLYMVDGVHLGALGQEDVIEMTPVDRSDASAHGKKQSVFTPKEMIEAGLSVGVFTITSAQ